MKKSRSQGLGSYLAQFASFTILMAVGCAESQPPGVIQKNNEMSALFVSKPADPQSELAQLQRHRGQTEFLNPVDSWSSCHHGLCQEKESAPQQSDSRQQQESDVFKVGRPGSKLIYLLNNYRGLQVVSYEDGVDQPKILGRVKATGNYPSDMYFDEKQNRLLVIEKYNYNSRSAESYQSRLLSYDVSNPAAPKLDQTQNLAGIVADSRIVGDVLYVASTQNESGLVKSYSLKSKSLKEVDSYTLPMKVNHSGSLNILTTESNGNTSYYLVATLSESGWGWWNQEGLVQVVDITNAQGQIRPIMSIAAKGFLRERSQTTIKNNTLIVTSNYFTDANRRIARIAVETFRFPDESSETISEKEAQYRKLHIDRALQGKHGEAYAQALEKLVSDAKLGIKGRFIQVGDDLRKMTPDSLVTVGDGSGLSANLQDVRYSDGLLYAFWVPANEIDPLDIFDISAPEKGVKYISRLQFDGWIERAIPMSYEGRRFIIGLGRIVPVVDNENQRRQPQAMIFEIINKSGRYKAEAVSQYTFEGSNIWTQYNDDDKTIEIHAKGDGQGEILFPATRFTKNNVDSGGQILKYNLASLVNNTSENALKPGAFLVGGSSWIRRLFTNKEIDRISSFSDQALATFGSDSAQHSGTLHPISILELARNVQSFETVGNLGIQFVSDYSWSQETQSTELRIVEKDKADSEKPQARSTVKLVGSYKGHIREANSGDLLVLTESYYQDSATDSEAPIYRPKSYLYHLKLNASQALVIHNQSTWYRDEELSWSMRRSKYHNDQDAALVQLHDGTLFANDGATVNVVSLTPTLTVQKLSLTSCLDHAVASHQIRILGGRPYLASEELLESQIYNRLEFTRNWISPLTLNGTKATCAQSFNVPGKVVAVTATGEILSEDNSVEDIAKRSLSENEKVDEYVTQTQIVSLKVKGLKAELVDGIKTEAHNLQPLREGEFVRLTTGAEYEFSKLEFIQLDQNAYLTTNTFAFNLDIEDGALVKIALHPAKPQHYLGLIQGSGQAQVIEWSEADRRPVIKNIIALNERFEKQTPARTVPVSSSGYYGWGPSSHVHFTDSQLSFEIAAGLSGVEQIFVKD